MLILCLIPSSIPLHLLWQHAGSRERRDALPSSLLSGCEPTVCLRQEMLPLLALKRLQPWTSQLALVVKILPASARDTGDAGLIPGLGRFPGVGNGTLCQYFCLGNFMGRGALWATVHGVGKSWTQPSD